jgi:RecA/RadA recombinase
LLCVRAQLPQQLNGLNSDVIFIDGNNTFNTAQVTRIAKLLHLDIKQVMDKIHVQHVTNAYEATSTVLDGLKKAVEKYIAKIVIVSGLAGLFLDELVPDEEAKRVFSQICAYLQSFARQNQITVIATYNPRPKSPRNVELQELSYDKANVVIKLTQTTYDREFALEKHPRFMLGCAEFPAENLTLHDFC